jgi:beta-phosphoglucomutase-like phosphatase (HAD superfamily)
MKEKHIITDCDGVLLNWNDTFTDFLSSLGHPVVPARAHSYSISDRHGLPSTDAIKSIKEFNEGPYMQSLPALADSVEYVRKLHAEGFEFTCVTSISDAPQSYVYRLQNLYNVFGFNFKELICLPMGANKKEALGRWAGSNYFWIEDHPQQAEAGASVGLKPILIQHPYNADYHNNDQYHTVPLANAWRDIYNVIKADYN